jgi:phasin family protein
MTQVFDFEKAMAPSKALTALSIQKTESLIALNTQLMHKYSAMSIANAKAAIELKDADGLKAYFEKQADVVKEVMESLAEDGKAMAKIGEEYATEVQKLVTDASQEVVAATKEVVASSKAVLAAPAAKKPAKAAPTKAAPAAKAAKAATTEKAS